MLKIPPPATPLKRGDKVSVWRKKDSRFHWGKVLIAPAKGPIKVQFKLERLGVLNVPVDRVTHRCVIKGCDAPARDGVKGHECARHRAEASALRPTGRMDEYPRDADTGWSESKVNGNGQSKINWHNDNCNFNFVIRDKRIELREDQNKAKTLVQFYGWYRRSRMSDGLPVHSIDVFCKRQLDDGSEADVSVDTVTYTEADPRQNIKSLEADLCAVAQKWMSMKVNGDIRSIDQLFQEARKPKVVIHRLATVDSIILRLKEIRDTAIRAGGTRFFEIEGDVKGSPTVLLEINVSAQAIALKGKPPSLYSGAVYDRVRDGKKGERIDPIKHKPSADNVKALQDALQRARDSGDVSTARKIRSAMRKMGHKGGGRPLNQK